MSVAYLKRFWQTDRGLEILEISKYKTKKLSLASDDMDFYYAFLQVGQYILNFCNRMDLPSGLDMTIPQMIVDALKYDWYTNLDMSSGNMYGGEFISKGNITSISEGDTQISYSKSSNGSDLGDALDSHNANLDEWIYNYNSILLNYRLLYKI